MARKRGRFYEASRAGDEVGSGDLLSEVVRRMRLEVYERPGDVEQVVRLTEAMVRARMASGEVSRGKAAEVARNMEAALALLGDKILPAEG